MQAQDESFESWWNRARAVEGALGEMPKDDKFVQSSLDSNGDSSDLDVVVVKVEPPLIDRVYRSVEEMWRQRERPRVLSESGWSPTVAVVRPVGSERSTPAEVHKDGSREFTQPAGACRMPNSPMSPRMEPSPADTRFYDPFVKLVSWSPNLTEVHVLDDNANDVKHFSYTIVLNEAGRQVLRTSLPQGYTYDEEIGPHTCTNVEVADDDQSVILTDDDDSSVLSVSSVPSSDDDGLSECARGGFHSCPDHNYSGYYPCEDDGLLVEGDEPGQNEDSNITVLDVINAVRELFPEDPISEAESSGFSNSFSEKSEEDQFVSCKSDEGEISGKQE